MGGVTVIDVAMSNSDSRSRVALLIGFALLLQRAAVFAGPPSFEEIRRAGAATELFSFVRKLCKAATTTGLDISAIRRVHPAVRIDTGADGIELHYQQHIVAMVALSRQASQWEPEIDCSLDPSAQLLLVDLKEHFGACSMSSSLDAGSYWQCHFDAPIKIDDRRSCSITALGKGITWGMNMWIDSLQLKIHLKRAAKGVPLKSQDSRHGTKRPSVAPAPQG